MEKILRQTRGGWQGHFVRRLIHLAMSVLPFIYYFYGAKLADLINIPLPLLMLILIGLIVLLEVIRLSLHIRVWGQRLYEKKQISAFAWGAISVALVLYFSPKEFGIPLILSWSLGDPLLGELRRLISNKFAALVGILFISSIWLVCGYFFAAPYSLAFLMGLVTVAAEWPNLKWIDDNATMLLLPLLATKLLSF